MKKVICKKTYDTETATLIKAYSFSQLEMCIRDRVDGSYVINHVSLVDPAGDAFRKEYAEKYNGAKLELLSLIHI